MTKVILSLSEMLGRGDHIAVEPGSEVVVGIFGWVMPFGLRFLGGHLQVVSERVLGNLERVVVIEDIVVDAEVGNEVVDVVTAWLLLVLVLVAAGGRADWIGLSMQISLRLDVVHLMAVLRFSGNSVSETILNIAIKPEVWYEVIPWWIGWWCLRGIIPSSKLRLSISSVQEAVFDVVVLAEIRDEIISWWPSWLREASGQ